MQNQKMMGKYNKLFDRKKIDNLTKNLNYQFSDESLLFESITHSSAVSAFYRKKSQLETKRSNERFEFLGDSVLGLALSTALVIHPKNYREGDLSKIRASLVNERRLAELCKKTGLDRCLIMSEGEEASGGRKKSSVLADALEALFGAIYLDSNFEEARRVILELYTPLLQGSLLELTELDHKSRLQEMTQSSYKCPPTYKVAKKFGPDHDLQFEVEVYFKNKILGSGTGVSKKKASQNAAKIALEKLQHNPGLLTEMNNNKQSEVDI